jgi:6-phosphogluconate dehydrogenase
MGMGVSGGEEGARRGPSMMPGGDEAAWHEIKPVLEAIAAKVNGEPCVAYMGKDAAGHFVKMVHNGIEYAIMQLISEAYDILHRGAGTSNEELHKIFDAWNKSELESFLIEITARVFTQKDVETGQYLVDLISDKAGSKGTGKWTSQEAMDLGIAIPTIDTAVAMRALSAVIGQRKQAAEVYKVNHSITPAEKEQLVADVKSALQFAIITCYAQGLSLLQRASVDLKMDIPLADVIKTWRGGCIIRSVLLKDLYNAFSAESNLENILLNSSIAEILKQHETAMRRVVTTAFEKGLMSAGLASALSYFDAFTTARMPTNLVQAQRDLFGAHTYERIDKPGSFHTEWN